MSSDIAISVRGLSKAYRIAHQAGNASTLAEAVVQRLRKPLNRPAVEEFWALRDVNFDVHQGDVVGVIGRNGAGKSTLLKVLSRITEPTAGEIRLHGRVGSLLEVGTGFSGELTGRENIFLNGAILGMTRRYIEKQFDAIVDFAGVEKFLDTPVKRYSSGMYVRLAFAVAAHLNPEILIVDEVLAVGDAEFQRKCINKMADVSQREGRTVLFVSHNMGVLQMLCERGILLRGGTVALDAPVGEAVAGYLDAMESNASVGVADRTDRRGGGKVRLEAVDVSTGGALSSRTLTVGEPARFRFEVTGVLPGLSILFTIYDHHGQPVTNFSSAVPSPEDRQGGGATFVCDLDSVTLMPGRYRLNVAVMSGGDLQDHLEGAALFDVEPGQLCGRPVAPGAGYSVVALPHRWTTPAGA